MRSRPLTALLALPLVAAVGCDPAVEEGPAPIVPPTLAACVGTPFTPAAARGFDKWWNEGIGVFGPAAHSMQDVVATPGAAAVVRGKFAYGTVSKDLEGETVRVYLDDCNGWRSLGEMTTDTDGRIAFAVTDALPVGVYDVRLEVLGDATVAQGRIWILPRGTRIAVSDIDGTLTTSDDELVLSVLADIFSGSYVPAAWPGAAALTTALTERAWVVIYLTGRPYWLTGRTRDWLDAGGFSLGVLHTTDSNTEAVPSESGVGAFKLAWLQGLVAQGFVLDQAYGNATTDVYAYAGAGIAPERTWIIGPNGGAGGTNAVDGSWQPRANEILAGQSAVQPFTR